MTESTRTPDLFFCAKCGAGLGNGGVDSCTVVVGMDPDRPETVRTLRFCIDREDAKGCSRKLVSPAMIKHYAEENRA